MVNPVNRAAGLRRRRPDSSRVPADCGADSLDYPPEAVHPDLCPDGHLTFEVDQLRLRWHPRQAEGHLVEELLPLCEQVAPHGPSIATLELSSAVACVVIATSGGPTVMIRPARFESTVARFATIRGAASSGSARSTSARLELGRRIFEGCQDGQLLVPCKPHDLRTEQQSRLELVCEWSLHDSCQVSNDTISTETPPTSTRTHPSVVSANACHRPTAGGDSDLVVTPGGNSANTPGVGDAIGSILLLPLA